MPDFAFPEFLAEDDGRRRLSDFRGQPVLIVNWTDTDFGRGAADRARKLSEELVPEGLVLILRDTHGRSADQVLASRLRLYPDSAARFVRNFKPPIAYQDNGPPPDVALIGIEGRLLVAGSYTADFNRAEALIEEQLERRDAGWGEHATVRRARALLWGKGRLGQAMELCRGALTEEPGQPELERLRAELDAQFAQRLAAIGVHLAHGEPLRARHLAEELDDAVQGHADWAARVDAALVRFEEDELKEELAFGAELEKLMKSIRRKGPRSNDLKKLSRLAERAEGTRVGQRAGELARLAELALAR